MSNKRIEDKLEFPSMMTNYLNADIRKTITVRVWKQAIPLKVTTLTENKEGEETMTISTRQSGYSLTMDITNQQQILSMPQNEKLLSYYFHFQKKINSSSSSEIVNKSYKQTNISSQIICTTNDEENPSPCNTEAEQVFDINLDGSEMYRCKCSPSTNSIHLVETSTTTIMYIPIPEPTLPNEVPSQIISRKTNNFVYIAFLCVIPLIVCVILIPIICLIMRRKKKKHSERPSQQELLEMPFYFFK